MSINAIAITVNGQPHRVPLQHSVSSLLEHLQLPADRVAVELNKSIVRKRDWSSTPVTDGSHLEIVEFVGGG